MDYLDGAKVLLELGADPNRRQGERGTTPIMFANSKSMLSWLISIGADPTAIDNEEMTLLHHLAPESAWNDCLAYALEIGLDPRIRDKQGRLAADIARDAGNLEGERLLLKAAALKAKLE